MDESLIESAKNLRDILLRGHEVSCKTRELMGGIDESQWTPEMANEFQSHLAGMIDDHIRLFMSLANCMDEFVDYLEDLNRKMNEE